MVVHMVQHILLLDVMPVLMILSLTKGLLRPITRRVMVIEKRAGVWRNRRLPPCCTSRMMGFWHIPAMYDAALAHTDVHVLEHLCFHIAGFLYWWHLLSPIRGRKHLERHADGGLHVGHEVLRRHARDHPVFAPHSLYPWYQDHQEYWGLTARIDQNLAGVVMTLEQSVIMGITLAYLFMRMLGSDDRTLHDERGERDLAMANYRTALAAARERERG